MRALLQSLHPTSSTRDKKNPKKPHPYNKLDFVKILHVWFFLFVFKNWIYTQHWEKEEIICDKNCWVSKEEIIVRGFGHYNFEFK